MSSLKKRLYGILELLNTRDPVTLPSNYFLITLIIISFISTIIESEPGIPVSIQKGLLILEYFTVGIFTLEYLIRAWICTENPKFGAKFSGRLKYLVSFFALIDLIAILPFYLPLVIPFDLRFLRVLRLIRMSRLLKLARYSEALKTIGRVFQERKGELGVALLLVLILISVASGLLFVAEHEAQPNKFSSILSSMWCAIITLTTIGYGDVFPITLLGKLLTAVIAFLGVGLFALPAGILASGFAEEIRRRKEEQEKKEDMVKCPHCGSLFTWERKK